MPTNRKDDSVTTQSTNSVPTNSEDDTVNDMSITSPELLSGDGANLDGDHNDTPAPNLSPGNIDEAFYLAMRSKLEEQIAEHNSLAEGIKLAGDRVALMDSLREKPEQTNDNEFIALVNQRNELSDALEAAEKAIAEKSEPFIQNHLKRSGVEEKQAKADEVAKQAKATLAFFSAMNASTDGLPVLANRSGRNSNTSGDGRGSGTPKYRNLEVYVDGKIADQKVNVKQSDGTVKPVRKSNLTYGAQAAGVPNDVLREAFIKAQGTSDAANFKDRVEFSVTDGNGKSHDVVVKRIPTDT